MSENESPAGQNRQRKTTRSRKSDLVGRKTLAENLRTIRQLNGWSLFDIHKLTGIPTSTLSKVENGKASLNFERLVLLTTSLGIAFDDLIDPMRSSLPRASRSITRADTGVRYVAGGKQFEFLSADLLASRNIAFKVKVTTPAGDDALLEFNHHAGEEFIYVLSGTLVLYSEYYEPLRLMAGDSIMFDASMAHAYAFDSDAPAEVIMVNEKYITVESQSVFEALRKDSTAS